MRSLKRSATSIHLWLGLTVGLFGMYLAATGGWILFRPQADALANPSYLTIAETCTRAVSLDKLVAEAAQVHKALPVELWWNDDPRSSVIIRHSDDQQSYFNPCTGAFLGLHSRWSGAYGFIEKLHRFRFFPNWFAEPMAGVFAIVMAVAMGGLGLFIWWPRRRSAWKPSLTLDRSLKGRARTRNRHSVVGAFASLGLLISAVTGIALSFDVVENFLYTATLSTAIEKPEAAKVAKGAPVALEATWRNALATMGAVPRAASLRLPTPKRSATEIYVYDKGNPNLEGRSYVYADPATGRIIEYLPYAKTPLGQRVYSWFVALHEGEVGGLAGQLFTLLTMFAILYLGYSGIRSYLQRKLGGDKPTRMRVAAIREEADGVKAFDLIPLAGRLPRFAAGAHVEVHVPGGPKRQYSLCNGPEQRDCYTIAVRLEEGSRGGSRGLHALDEGQELLVGRPRNHFPIDRGTGHATLIAAGIGITPMLCMARHLEAQSKPWVLHYFGRTAEGMPYRELLASSGFSGRSHIHVGLGRQAIPEVLRALLAERPTRGHVYTCGPEAFMEAVADAAMSAGWPQHVFHQENFAPPAAAFAGPREEIEVTLARSNRKLTVPPEQTVLEALTSAGINIPRSCEQGTCGDCAVQVCGGDIDHRDRFLSDAERARGDVMLTCVSRAKGRALVVEL